MVELAEDERRVERAQIVHPIEDTAIFRPHGKDGGDIEGGARGDQREVTHGLGITIDDHLVAHHEIHSDEDLICARDGQEKKTFLRVETTERERHVLQDLGGVHYFARYRSASHGAQRGGPCRDVASSVKVFGNTRHPCSGIYEGLARHSIDDYIHNISALTFVHVDEVVWDLYSRGRHKVHGGIEMRFGRRFDNHKRGPAYARGIVEIIEMSIFRHGRYAIKVFVLGTIEDGL